MTGTIKRTTTHYNMRIPIFDAPGWGRELERNLDIIDAVVFAATNFSLVKGLWTNSTLYNVGDRVVDEDTNTIWECLVQHTSAATGTFEDDRTANPTYWQIVSTIVQNRGVWQPGTSYKYNDFVEFGNKVAVTVVPSYTSGASFDDDVLNNNLHVVIDLDPQVSAASASAGAAAASASAAQTSEINAASSASAASVSAGNASSSASAAASSASAASVSASNAASSASQAASSKTAAEAAKTASESARDQSQAYRNEALNFRNQAEGFKNSAAASAAAAATFDPDNFYTKTAANGLFFPKTGGNLTGSLLAIGSLYAQAPTNGNAHVWLRNADGKNRGLMYWDRNNGVVVLRVYADDGNGNDIAAGSLELRPSGAITFNGYTVWHSGNLDPWAVQPIGVPIPVWDHIVGFPYPPRNKGYRYVVLRAGQTGAGAYNEGILTNETVSGSAPLINATAEINLPASPMHGQTIRLICTEQRFLRAGVSGERQDDAVQDHTHSQIRDNAYGGGAGGPTNFFWGSTSSSTGGVNSGRVANETRPRNIGATYFMRIL